MFRSIAGAISLILIIGTPNFVQAGGGCPGGYTPQDGVCKPYRGPYVAPGYGYGYGYRYAPPPQYFQPDWRYGARGCPSGYTVQDGLCRPYRGY
jgi:hypothetical protein